MYSLYYRSRNFSWNVNVVMMMSNQLSALNVIIITSFVKNALLKEQTWLFQMVKFLLNVSWDVLVNFH